MRFAQASKAAAVLAFVGVGSALKATILADTNHDGVIDAESDKKDGEAIFIANIGDTDKRCSKTISISTSDEEIDRCNDANGNEQRNSKYLAPLKTLPAEGAKNGTIRIVEDESSEKARIFVKAGDKWNHVEADHTFTGEEIKNGLELGIDARDIRRPDGWDGRTTVRFTVKDDNTEYTDEVKLRVAPVMTHHHGQSAQKLLATLNGRAAMKQFVSDLEDNSANAGLEDSVFRFTQSSDIWAQDFFEPGFTSFPGPDGPIVLRIMIRSAQIRDAGRQVFTELRSDSVGAVQVFQYGGTLDSGGNIETVPPHTHNGKSYPAGRIIMGHYENEIPSIIPFFKSQEIQDPIRLDTEWLAVGHVDEFVQFLPSDSERGWVMMADDPMLGLELLQKASKDGHGKVRALSRPNFDYDDSPCLSDATLDKELNQPDFISLNEASAKRIQNNIEILKNETGITDEEIFRLPALYYTHDNAWSCSNEDASSGSSSGSVSKKSLLVDNDITELEAAGGKSFLQRRQSSEKHVIAHWPGVINGVVLSDSYYLAPNPWGPVVDGKDIIVDAVSEIYAKANYNVTFMDDWFSHHTRMGEVHCGSNTFRDASQAWW